MVWREFFIILGVESSIIALVILFLISAAGPVSFHDNFPVFLASISIAGIFYGVAALFEFKQSRNISPSEQDPSK